MHDVRQLGDVLHQIIVLGAAAGDANGIAFLESVGADQVSRDLSRDHDQRDGVHQGVDDAGHRVGRSWSRRHQYNTRLARRPGIPLRRVRGALFVPDENMAEPGFMKKCVIDRQNGPAWITEKVGDALVYQHAHDHLGAGEDFLGLGSRIGLDALIGGHRFNFARLS